MKRLQKARSQSLFSIYPPPVRYVVAVGAVVAAVAAVVVVALAVVIVLLFVVWDGRGSY